MQFYWLTVTSLCVWRLTHMLAAEDGPWDLVLRLRRAVGAGFWGKLLDCFHCLSLWVALPFALVLGDTWTQHLLHWPGLSAVALLLERVGGSTVRAPLPTYHEDEEN